LWSSSAGLLLYAALVDLLAADFLSEEANATLTKKDRILAFGCVILGGETQNTSSWLAVWLPQQAS
jgi:hypothetical protein